MRDWLVDNLVIVAAILLLLLVGSLPAPSQRLRAWTFPLLFVFLALGAGAFELGLRQTQLVTDSTVSSTLKYALDRIGSAKEPNLLVVDGGSLAQKGVDANLLAEELEKRGYRVRVVRLALAAANHFERYQLHHDLLERLPRTVIPGQRRILLAEVGPQYDLQPLAQFHRNGDTARAFHYLTAGNAFHALRAQQDPRLDPPAEGFWQWDLARHVAINAFNVGAASRLVPLDSVDADRGGIPTFRERLKRRVNVEGLQREIRRPTPDPAPPPWLARIRERRLSKLWGTRLDELVYFGTPSTRVDQLKYVRGFCQHTKRKCIPPTDAKLYSRLESRALWLDETHLSPKGAQAYTKWLAQRLIEEDVLVD